MNGDLPSLYTVLINESERIRADLNALINQSRVAKRFDNAGGGLVMITARPFEWEPLPIAARGLQAHLRESYRHFSALVRAVLAAETESTHDELTEVENDVLRILNQDGSIEYDTAANAGRLAADALSRQVAYVEHLWSSNSDPILVPDTNALIFNPALEDWTFADPLRRFRMAITPTVLAELDLLKTRDVVRQKAERLIRQIREYRRRGRLFDGVPLRTGVSTIFSVAAEPLMEKSLPWLDAMNRDDRLIASTIEIARRNIRAIVAIVTRDANVENKADFAGLPCVHPPTAAANQGK